MDKAKKRLLYNVGFHLIKPKNKYQLYTFLSKEKAYSFFESIKEHPNVKDGFLNADPIDDVDVYDGARKKSECEFIDRFERSL